MKKEKTKLEKNDVFKNLYFIAEMAQNTGEKGMYGTIAGKSDFMGGIFDRWINLVPESVVFNKIILPKVSNDTSVEIITDFYKYAPKQETTGIAPDVLGLRINGKVVPFVVFDEKWTPIKGMPQIEVKTFKESQKMVSLRDQGYAGKYLVLVESNLRVDYLLPFFDSKYFSDNIYQQMTMDDEIFIKSNSQGLIHHLKKVDCKEQSLGTLSLLLITETTKFEKCSTYCGPGITPLPIKDIEESKKAFKNPLNDRLIDYVEYNSGSTLYSFKNNWYKKEIEKFKFLDFYCDKPQMIKIVQRNKLDFFIMCEEECSFNEFRLKPDKVYKITMHNAFSRDGADGGEYFIQKSLIDFIPDLEGALLKQLKEVIEKNI